MGFAGRRQTGGGLALPTIADDRPLLLHPDRRAVAPGAKRRPEADERRQCGAFEFPEVEFATSISAANAEFTSGA